MSDHIPPPRRRFFRVTPEGFSWAFDRVGTVWRGWSLIGEERGREGFLAEVVDEGEAAESEDELERLLIEGNSEE